MPSLRTGLAYLKRGAYRTLKGDIPNLKTLSAPYRGSVDGVDGGVLRGWVAHKSTGAGGLSVGVFLADRLIASETANVYRGDVEDAGIGDGCCGFEINLEDSALAMVMAQEQPLRVSLLGSHSYEVGQLSFSSLRSSQGPSEEERRERIQFLLNEDISALASLLDEDRVYHAPKLAHHDALFSPLQLPSVQPTPATRAPTLPGYVEFSRYRLRTDDVFDTTISEDVEQCLSWYLTDYAGTRLEYRVPLSKDAIDHLNEPIVMGGQPFVLTRIMWWRLVKNKALMAGLDLANHAWFMKVVFWWAYSEAPKLNLEDCCVSLKHLDMLRAVHFSRKDDVYPLSTFMDLFYAETPALHFLKLHRPEARETLTHILMVQAAQRPDLLRFIPARSLTRAFEIGEDGQTRFGAFVRDMGLESLEGALDKGRYADALRGMAFDVESQSFLTLTKNGHRVHAAALPVPDPAEPPVDLQLIGPFEKASGLGQAARLSQEAAGNTGLSINAVNFGLDNPAPEGFSKVGQLSGYKNAKVNLIHLNAESIPLAFAYEPDVFSDSYNIGYFFWELDTPAHCHYLGMGMLDEIWVSTEYGVDIYKPDSDIPVTNVGMCFEVVPNLDRESSRRFIDSRFRFDSDEFVFLVAFDSFSFVQRKNPLGVLEAFQSAFKDVDNVRLVIKTQNRDSVLDPVQARIWKKIDAIVDADHRIRVLNETLTYEDLLRLKKGSDCYISLHKSEGWGFGMIEAMNLKVPVISTAYSGNLEFCNEETAFMVGYTEEILSQNDYIFVRDGQKWALPDTKDAARQMRTVYDDETLRNQKAESAWRYVQEHFSAEAIGKRYASRLREILKDIG